MSFGTEIDDLDDLAAAVREHRFVVMRGAAPDLRAQVACTRALGHIVGSSPGVPQVRHEDEARMHPDQAFFNERWHADVSWCAEGPVITVLVALRAGRDAAPTSFVDTVSGYERLEPRLQDAATGWTARHHVERSRHLRHGRGSPLPVPARRRHRVDPPPASDATVPTYVDEPGAAHPVTVSTSTGATGVLLGDHAWTLDGFEPEDGAARVDEMQRRVVAGGEHHVHRWRRGDVVAFDNRTVLHRREPMARSGRRRVLRRTIAWPLG